MPKIYTKRGDTGSTDIYRGNRASRKSKDDPLYELLGKLDETSVWLGKCAIISCIPVKHQEYLRVLQQEIILISAAIQSPLETPLESTVDIMESLIDELAAELPPLTRFLLTVASPDDGIAQTARVLARETERIAVQFFRGNIVNIPEVLRFLNRLSDYLFTLGRYIAQNTAESEIVSRREIIDEFRVRYYSV